MKKDELIDFAENYTDGVHMATPVFDGAKENEIKALLKEAGVSDHRPDDLVRRPHR